jgi:hypothetical protein
MPVAPSDTTELTCSRAVCHVVYTVPVDLVPLLLGGTCPKCGRGVLELRERVAAERIVDA